MNPYLPERLPIADLRVDRLITLVGEANALLARYDESLRLLVNPSLLLMHITKHEALLSSRIEGTQATLYEVYELEAGKTFPETHDVLEVINYQKALKKGQEQLGENTPQEYKKITLHLLRALHKVLLSGVRGQNKNPGDFRKEQNWIGAPGSKVENARFIPPNPMQLTDHLVDFERYLTEDDRDALIQAAIMHAQFELLHPFLDGNGRIGRLLIPLFLYQKGKLHLPVFYLSEYLEKNQQEYYDRLAAISEKGAWTEWVEFFLRAIVAQARSNLEKTRALDQFYQSAATRIRRISHSQYNEKILRLLFTHPIFRSKDWTEARDKSDRIPTSATQLLLREMVKDKFLTVEQERSGRAPAIYIFQGLFDFFDPPASPNPPSTPE